MPVTKVVVSDSAQLDAQLTAHAGQRLFVLFSGAPDASGASWCPDCNDAQPVIDAALEKAAACGSGMPVVLLYAPLMRAEYRGNAAHWARVHPAFRLERIPTLFKMGRSKPVGSLVEDACKSASAVEELVSDDA